MGQIEIIVEIWFLYRFIFYCRFLLLISKKPAGIIQPVQGREGSPGFIVLVFYSDPLPQSVLYIFYQHYEDYEGWPLFE